MSREYYSAEDYNVNGDLTLPWYYWILMLIQSKAWIIVLVFAYIGIDVPDDISDALWPDNLFFYLSLIAGLPALLCVLLYYFRSKVGFAWKLCYFGNIAGIIASIAATMMVWLILSAYDNELALILLTPDVLCLVMYVFNQRVINAFFPLSLFDIRSSRA